ncbi:MAG: efflux RND transporter periplasmic adaptor subunit [Methylococcaceae bacterium]|nr:efflux RND transporter periplasmic adaptor subunit [Methylococcaceae bacterium]
MKHHTFAMQTHKNIIAFLLLSFTTNFQARADDSTKTDANAPKPALTVTVDKPQQGALNLQLTANGNVAAWQEAIIGTEADGLRLADVLVNVGDQVKKGQVLATFATETVAADLAQIKANVAEAEASLAEAADNAKRARSVAVTGALSEQQISQYFSAEKTAKARLLAQQAAVKVHELRLIKTKVLAPDSGVISSRTATLGAVLPRGQELFRLIRQSRLEWRAEVAAAELLRLPVGTPIQLHLPDGKNIAGKVRMIAPTVDPKTRLGLVYVDIPVTANLKAGMFLKGVFALGQSNAFTAPQQAVVVRDGFNYLFCINKDNRVTQVKVQIGRRDGERVEIISGLAQNAAFVVNGAGFLNDGDLVKVVAAVQPVATTQ